MSSPQRPLVLIASAALVGVAIVVAVLGVAPSALAAPPIGAPSWTDHAGAAQGLPSVRVDRNDNYPADGIVDSIATTRYTYSTQGLLLNESLEYDFDADGITDYVAETDYTYDGDGRLILRVGFETESWVYDAQGNILEHELSADGGAYVDRETFVRDPQGRPLSRARRLVAYIFLTESTDTYTAWEAHRQPTAWTTISSDSVSDGAEGWILQSTFSSVSSATHDGRGLVLSETTHVDNGPDEIVDQVTTKVWTRDARGNELTRVEERDDAADGSVNYRQTRTSAYDRQGARTSYSDFTDYNGNGVSDLYDYGFDETYANDRRGNHLAARHETWSHDGMAPVVAFAVDTTWTY